MEVFTRQKNPDISPDYIIENKVIAVFIGKEDKFWIDELNDYLGPRPYEFHEVRQ